MRYRIARWASAWSPLVQTTGTVATINRPQGIAEHALFAVLETGEAQLVVRFWTSR